MERYEEFARILLSEDVPFERTSEILTGIGVADPVKAEKNIQLLGGRGEGFEAFRKILPQALRSLADVADPDAALNNWERLVGTRRNRKSHFTLLTESPQTLKVLLKIAGASHYLSNILISRPDLLREEIESGAWKKPLAVESLDAELSALLEKSPDYDSSLTVLREFKWRHMLGIGARDICGTADVGRITLETSRLAEACVRAALGIAGEEIDKRFGSPSEDISGIKASMVVLAFGKLGGEELNYSSDIDLTFMYSHDGESMGKGSISNHEYFSKVAEKCIDALARHTDMGHLFRVDMRLRPMGSKGPLVSSLEAHLFYYESYGEWWERQALLKARPVAGDMELARRFLKEMRPFVYPRYIDHRGIRELQALKLRTERLVNIEGLAKTEVKLGRGGIRDIEFTVQFQQLLNGGRHPELRGTNTLAALGALEKIGTISQAERESLADAYLFLRRLENRLQIMQNRQLHVLPSDPREIETLARGLGYPASDGKTAGDIFRGEYSRHTDRVRELFDKFFGKMFEGADRAAPVVNLILNPDPSESEMDAALGHYGFADRRAALKNLRLLAEGSASSPYPSRTRDLFADIVGILLQHLEQSPDPDMALNNVQRCVAALGAPSTFYEILAANPKAFTPLVALSSYSDHLIRLLVNDPGVIDFLLGTRILEAESSRANIQKALGEFISVNPDFHEAVQRFKNGELLRIGLRDTLGLADIAEVTRELSYLAGAVLEQVYGRCLEEHISRYGEPLADDDSPATMSILGAGKLGGREINYASDLDVIFVYSAGGQTAGGRSEAISCQQFFASLAAKVMKKMAELNPYGYLYKMDARLRPDGAQGLLAVSSDSFIEYYGNKGAIWEKRAMTKLRRIAGDEALGERVEQFVRQTIYAPGFFGSDVIDDAMTMLGKIIDNVESGAGDGMQIKGAQGGIVEIEFLVQLLQLKHGTGSEELRVANTLKALAALVEGGFLSRKEHDDLTATLVFLRRVEDRLRLMHDRSLSELPSAAEELDKLALRLDLAGVPGQRPGEMLVGTIESHINRSHRVFEEQIDRLREG